MEQTPPSPAPTGGPAIDAAGVAAPRAVPAGQAVEPPSVRRVAASGDPRRVPPALRQIVGTIVIAALIALALQIAVQNYLVEGTSMLPTVRSGDRVLVNRLAYRVGSPRRGDIVVFRLPWADTNLIKRIIGLPGDVVTIEPGQVDVNGRVLREPYIRNTENYTYGPSRVPSGAYFVLGDNRVVSSDSHIWGFLPARYLYGRVLVTYWPLGNFHLYGL